MKNSEQDLPQDNAARSVQIGIRLQPVGHSNQPIFSNFTAVQATQGIVFLDFGFVEAGTFNTVARLSNAGDKLPEAIGGLLGCRVALNQDTAMSLLRQLTQLFGAAAKRPPAAGGENLA